MLGGPFAFLRRYLRECTRDSSWSAPMEAEANRIAARVGTDTCAYKKTQASAAFCMRKAINAASSGGVSLARSRMWATISRHSARV